MSPFRLSLVAAACAACLSPAVAADPVKHIPPAGIPVPDDVRAELTKGADQLGAELVKLKSEFASDPARSAEIPDAEVFHKSVDWALKYDEFFDAKEFDTARAQLIEGTERAKAIREGKYPWNAATGLVVRGYRSQIDDSIQPYGLVVPADYIPGEDRRRSLHLWFHGRGEKLTELAFIKDRSSNKGEFVPDGAIVLHLYGRFCNANKFAGEIDAFEAMRDVVKHYPIDPLRVTARGFSMGGAAAWHMAVHHAQLWAAAAPGAGFAETQEFFKSFAEGKTPPPWWEMVLWRWYDATVYARNLTDLPLVAYSGEIDGQKQAADIMTRFAKEEGVSFPHIIGPQTPHKYHPDSKPQIEAFVTDAVTKGRTPKPNHLVFTTYTLVYPGRTWATIMQMERQWERADFDVTFDKGVVTAKTKNIAAIRFEYPDTTTKVVLDGNEVPASGKSGTFSKIDGQWRPGFDPTGKKWATFSGPIDHAFMTRFLHVKPTGTPLNEAAGTWAASELAHATTEWRRVFRGIASVKDDTAVSDADIASNNLVLWGDASSNAVLKKIIDRLPLKWSRETLEFRGYKLDAAHYVPILIFPNPLNPKKYVVLNSGHTFRERAALNNSDQTPKLPDWAIVDLRTPPNDQWPGLVYDAGFFDEAWH